MGREDPEHTKPPGTGDGGDGQRASNVCEKCSYAA